MTPPPAWSSTSLCATVPLLLLLTCWLLGDVTQAQQQCPNECNCFGTFVSCYQFNQESLLRLPTNADTLVLSGGNITSFPPAFARKFPLLTLLDIQSTHVETVLSGTFSGIMGLDQLAVTDCQFGNIEGDAFKDISAVSQILFSGSYIGTIHSGAFSTLSNIGEFSIWSSTISRVEARAFTGLSNLNSFAFYENNVSNLHRQAFVNVENLGKVDVYMNKFFNAKGSAVIPLQAATSDMNMYSNTFPCNCGVVRDFHNPLLSPYIVSQKCQMSGQVMRLSEVDVDELCLNEPSTTSSSTTSTSTSTSTLSSSTTEDLPTFKVTSPIKVTQTVHITTSSSPSNGGKLPTTTTTTSFSRSTFTTSDVTGHRSTSTEASQSGTGQGSGQTDDSSNYGNGASWRTQVAFVPLVTTVLALWLVSAC